MYVWLPFVKLTWTKTVTSRFLIHHSISDIGQNGTSNSSPAVWSLYWIESSATQPSSWPVHSINPHACYHQLFLAATVRTAFVEHLERHRYHSRGSIGRYAESHRHHAHDQTPSSSSIKVYVNLSHNAQHEVKANDLTAVADAELPPIPSQHARILIQDHSKSRVDSCDAWKVSPPVPASTHTDVFSFPPKETPTRGATHDSTTGRTHNMQPRLPQNSSRTSQITLVDEEEYKNPTSIFAYPAAARMNPRRSNISEIWVWRVC